MDYSRHWEELMARAGRDELYQYSRKLLEATEPDYHNIRDKLTQEEQDVLDDYIGFLEAMDDCMVWCAYEMGRAHATRDLMKEG